MKERPVSSGVTAFLLGWFSAILLTLGLVLSASGRTGEPPLSQTLQWKDADQVEVYHTPPVDHEKNRRADKANPRLQHTKMRRFAEPFPVQIDFDQEGTWTSVPGKGLMWRLKVISPNATDLNFGFHSFKMPKGATLHISSTEHDFYQGPYHHGDNQAHGQLWTPVVPGESAMIEVFIPNKAAFHPELFLTQVAGGYRDLFKLEGRSKQGSCNIDTICPEGDPWRDEIQSVGMYSVGGIDSCTGTMVRDASSSFRNFFLTAAHCGLDAGNAPSVVVYWNFESPSCGALSGGPKSQTTSGATFRAAQDDVDMALIELNQDPLPSYNVFYAGWSRVNAPAGSTVAIHHPNVDEKAISFNNNAVASVESCINFFPQFSATHWEVDAWEQGTTEPGSSGSAIFDGTTKRVVGFLSGGTASCSSPFEPDCYGKVSWAWDVNGDPTQSLAPWLDSGNTGTNGIDGSYVGGEGTGTGVAPGGTAIGSQTSVTFNVELPKPTLRFPDGGEVLPTAGTINVTWENGLDLPELSQTTFEWTAACSTLSQGLTEDMEDGQGDWSFNGPDQLWWRVTSDFDRQGFSWFSRDREFVTDRSLVSPQFIVPSVNPLLSFRHRYNLEAGGDGGTIEISSAGPLGPWVDLGAGMVVGGYNTNIATGVNNPLAGRNVFSGNSVFFRLCTINLDRFRGLPVHVRFRMGTNDVNEDSGWWVDDFSVFQEREWISGGQSDLMAESVSWNLPVIPGDDYCIRIRHENPFYLDSAWCVGQPFSLLSAEPTDSDGLPDSWEEANRLDPLNAADEHEDADGDGKSNLEEYLSGTDPNDPNSFLKVKVVPVSGSPGQFNVLWDSIPDRNYSLLSSTTLAGSWSAVLSNVPATPPLNSHLISVPDNRARYYLLQVNR